MHASSSGLKALCTFTTAEGLEDCRKSCGGHGVLLSSGIAQLTIDYVTYCTAEGDRIILELQCARFLIKSYEKALNSEPLSEICNYLNIVSNSSFNSSKMPFCNHIKNENDVMFNIFFNLYLYLALILILIFISFLY